MWNLMRITLFFAFLLICSEDMFAQFSMSGLVVDELTNEPLIGVVVQSEDNVAISDTNGEYFIKGITLESIIEFSYIGYESKKYSGTEVKNLYEIVNVKMTPSENLLQTATVTSGKYEKPLGEITVSLELLKLDLLEAVNATNLDGVLEKVPGVTVIDGQANIRGGAGYSFGAGSRVLILVDDIPALQSDSGTANWDDIPIELTNQIEIIKGASSALFGSSALNGIINLRTDFAKEERETKVATFYTLYDTPRDASKKWWGPDVDTIPSDVGAYITHKQKYGKLDFVGSVYLRNHKRWNRNTFETYARGALGLRYRLNKNWSFGVNGSLRDGSNGSFFFWQDAESLALTGNPGTITSSESTRFIIDPFVQYLDDNGNKHKLLSRYYNVRNNVVNNQSNFSSLLYGEYQFQKRIFDADLVFTTGVVGTRTDSEADLFSNESFDSNNIAVYAQAEKKFLNKLNVSLGVRYERNQINAPDSIPINTVQMEAGSDTESRPVFRLGANYQLSDNTFLRASFGQGYRFPTIAEKFISTQVGFAISPNLDLRSERGWSAEIGIKQGIKINGFKGLIDFALFQTEYQDMLEFTFSNVFAIGFQSQNIGNSIIRGVDISIAGEGQLFNNIPLKALVGYTYLDPRFQDFGEFEKTSSSSEENILKYRYQHTGKLDIETGFPKFNLGVAGFYYSNLEAIDRLFSVFITGLEQYRAENDNPFSVWNVRLSYIFMEKYKVSAHINNILNNEYTLRPALIEAPRHFTLRLDASF